MRLFALCVLLSLLSLSSGFGQSVDLVLSVSDGVSTAATLHFGLDTRASDTLDAALGETELPPLPPTGVFDARFVGTDIGLDLGQGTLRDYRKGDSTLIGTRIHEITYQVGSGTAVSLSWSLPPWVEGRLQDVITGSLIDTVMKANGSYTVTNPGAIAKLRMTVRYGIEVPATPTLSWPPYGATGLPVQLDLTWLATANASLYHVQVGKDSTFASGLVVNDSAIAGTSRSVGSLEASTVYFWRVKAKNAGGASAFSGTWKFKTTLAAPTLTSPVNNATGVGTLPTLTWQAVAEAQWYRLQLAADSLMQNLVMDTTVSAVTTVMITTPLTNDKSYYWRVRASNSEAQGAWSTLWTFTTVLQVPAQVTLVYPADLAMVSPDSVRFVWRQGTPSVTRYWFEMATDSLFTFRKTDSSAVDTARFVYGLSSGQTYWWKVAAKNAAGWGSFSVRSFTVLTTSVRMGEGLPEMFSLSQNYPNPFNPSTTIRYALPHRSHVTLTVYNTLSQMVATLVNGEVEAGYHEVEFNAAGLASGMYFYRIQAGSFVDTKKLLLVK